MLDIWHEEELEENDADMFEAEWIAILVDIQDLLEGDVSGKFLN